MRLGLIAPEFPPEHGGMQMMALHLARHLARTHEVVVCTKGGSREAGPFQVLTNLKGRTREDLAALNRVPVDRWLGMNAGYAALAGELRAPAVFYFHGNDFLDPWTVSTPPWMRALRKAGINGPHRRLATAVLRAGVGSARRILTNSVNTRRLLHEAYPGVQVLVCPPGVGDAFFQPHEPASGPTPLRLLSVSRLRRTNRRKNIAGVLEAIALLRGQLDLRYTVVGDGNDRAALERLARRLALGAQVRFTGRVGDAELLAEYRRNDLFVLPVKPSPGDVEGFGIVYLEANASGMPVLCSDEGGPVDAVRDGETGIVAHASTPRAIADALLHFTANRDRFDEAALRRFSDGFRWERAAARIEQALLA